MAKKYVFLAHGMGTFQTGWDAPFREAVLKALMNYSPFSAMTAAQIEATHIKFVPLTYDNVLDGFRQRWKDAADEVTPALAAEWPEGQGLFSALTDSGNAQGVPKGFFWSHLLDPLLWYTLPTARMRVISEVISHLIDDLAEMYTQENDNTSYVIAHSLGTSVVHDSLVALRWMPQKFLGGKTIPNIFKPGLHKWKAVATIANVSRLLQARQTPDAAVSVDKFDPEHSVLAPGMNASICDVFLNARHRIDPFTWPRQFAPKWSLNYVNVETVEFNKIDAVHDFEHYIANPKVHVPLFRLMYGSEMCAQDEQAGVQTAFDAAYPHHADTELSNLRGLFNSDINLVLSPQLLGEYLHAAAKELQP
jgi:hypothetical protein